MPTDFVWNEQRERAARLLAEGCTSYGDVAVAVGVSDETLSRWRRFPEFQRRVQDLSIEFAGDLRTHTQSATVSVRVRSTEIVDHYWQVAQTSKSAQARVAALNSLAQIAGLLGRRDDSTHVNLGLQVVNSANSQPEIVEVVGFEKHVLEDKVGRRDVRGTR